MDGVTYRDISFQCWLLIGLTGYIVTVLMIIYARYCLQRRTFCPFSNCCLHCTCESKLCMGSVCQSCGMQPILSKPFCCKQKHLVNEPSCFSSLPSLKYQCFLPNCSYFYCLCCEVSIENEYGGTPSVVNCVQNI